MADDSAKENSVTGMPDQGLQVFTGLDAANSGVTVAITHDPTNGTATLSHLNSTTGEVLGTGVMAPQYNGAGAPSVGLV